jgi:hypothetical protein
MIISFLQDFAKLTRTQQEIFLFCLRECPFPQKNTNDIQYIAAATHHPYKSVWIALQYISTLPTLSKLVKYTHSGISPHKTVPIDVLFKQGKL